MRRCQVSGNPPAYTLSVPGAWLQPYTNRNCYGGTPRPPIRSSVTHRQHPGSETRRVVSRSATIPTCSCFFDRFSYPCNALEMGTVCPFERDATDIAASSSLIKLHLPKKLRQRQKNMGLSRPPLSCCCVDTHTNV